MTIHGRSKQRVEVRLVRGVEKQFERISDPEMQSSLLDILERLEAGDTVELERIRQVRKHKLYETGQRDHRLCVLRTDECWVVVFVGSRKSLKTFLSRYRDKGPILSLGVGFDGAAEPIQRGLEQGPGGIETVRRGESIVFGFGFWMT